MKIDILCVGKIKERFYADALAEYLKRMQRYAQVNILEVKDEKTPDGASEKMCGQIKEAEGQRLLRNLRADACIVVLAIEGTQMTSESFSDFIARKESGGVSHIQFVIGGSLGLSDEVKQKADLLLSFSSLTFPHQLMRVILLEQIYRAYRIKSGEPYHK